MRRHRQDAARTISRGDPRPGAGDNPSPLRNPELSVIFAAYRANLNLDLGRLSLSLLVGIYRCHQASTGFILLDQTGAPVEHPQAKEITRRMCGAAYEYAYSRNSLEDFVHDASLVEHYLAIAKEVKGG